jgi:FMN phosphatase YigB (HAD superfamily)
MKYKAVVFDLFGTLVDIFSRSEYDRVLRKWQPLFLYQPMTFQGSGLPAEVLAPWEEW